MTKHIIISGVPRAGKSTVSRLIAKRYGYQHISMDAVIAGFEQCFPETGVSSYIEPTPEGSLRAVSRKMAPFLRAMMDSGEYDELDYGMVIDMYRLLPEDYVKYIDPQKCAAYYFVTAEVSVEERLRMLKEYDTPNDYTFFEPEEKRLARCEEIVAHSRLLREQCQRYGLPCFETSWERAQVLQRFVDSLVAV